MPGQRAFRGGWGRGNRTKVDELLGERRWSRQRQLTWPENQVWAPSLQSATLCKPGVETEWNWGSKSATVIAM